MAQNKQLLNAIQNELARIISECNAVATTFKKIDEETLDFEQKADEKFNESRFGTRNFLVQTAWKLKHGYGSTNQNVLNIEQMVKRITRMVDELAKQERDK